MIHFPDLTIHSDVFQRLTKYVLLLETKIKNSINRMCSRNAKGFGHIIILFENERSIGGGNTNLRITGGKIRIKVRIVR